MTEQENADRIAFLEDRIDRLEEMVNRHERCINWDYRDSDEARQHWGKLRKIQERYEEQAKENRDEQS